MESSNADKPVSEQEAPAENLAGNPPIVADPSKVVDLSPDVEGIAQIPIEDLKRAGSLLGAALQNLRVSRRIGIDSLGEIIENEIIQAAMFLGINFITRAPEEELTELSEAADATQST